MRSATSTCSSHRCRRPLVIARLSPLLDGASTPLPDARSIEWKGSQVDHRHRSPLALERRRRQLAFHYRPRRSVGRVARRKPCQSPRFWLGKSRSDCQRRHVAHIGLPAKERGLHSSGESESPPRRRHFCRRHGDSVHRAIRPDRLGTAPRPALHSLRSVTSCGAEPGPGSNCPLRSRRA